jgi:hypothetical protein
MPSAEILLAEQIWNNLRIPIIIGASIAPVVIVFLIIRYNRIIKRLEVQHRTNQKIVEKRLEIYERVGPKLNDILNFFLYSGNWKELSPVDLIRLKRELDREITVNTPLFSADLSAKYNGFIHLCFVSFSGWEHEEKIKSLYELRQKHNREWKDDWIPYFDTNNVVEGITLKERYEKLLDYFKEQLSNN